MSDIDIRTRIGLRIKQIRAERGLTQDALAYGIGLSRSYLAEVETGKRNVSAVNIERISNGLGISLSDFFSGELFDSITQDDVISHP